MFAFCPTRKIRDFSRGDPVCACGFAPQSILALRRYFAGTPLCFRKRIMQDVRLLRVFSLYLETIALLSDFCSAGWRLPPHFYRKASLATPRRNLWGVCFLPHAKNQRFFPRGPRLCLRLCPTKCPRFAAVLCGGPVVFPQKKNARCSPRSSFLSVAPELSRCSLIFAPRGGQLPPPVLFFKDERVLCCRTIMPPRHDQSIS